MRGKNRHLTEKDRYYIEKRLEKDIPVVEIAEELGFCRQTIYAEIKKGTFERLDCRTWKTQEVYAYDVGQRVHNEKMERKKGIRKLKQDDAFLLELKYWILEMKYSPEAALCVIRDKKLCLRSCYHYIHSGYIPGMNTSSLPYARPRKKKKSSPRKTMPKGRSIEERPEEINSRETYGHWEMDTVYSSRDDLTCLLTLTERKFREEIIIKMPDRTAASVNKAIDCLERKMGTPAFRRTFLSITCDNGVEFSDWEHIEKSCRTKGSRTIVYFAHPYSSYERATNENHNRLVRRWIPKGDDIGLYSQKEIQWIENWINEYPRRMFSGRSSREQKLVGEFPEQKNSIVIFKQKHSPFSG